MVLAQLLGGAMDSALYHGEREELGAAYTVGARIETYKDATVMTMGAKAGLMAQERHAGAVDEGMASMLGSAALEGLSPTAIQDRAGLVAAVSAADVRAVARRYLAPEALRAVLDGRAESTVGAQSLGLGEPVFTDIHGRPAPPVGSVAVAKKPGN